MLAQLCKRSNRGKPSFMHHRAKLLVHDLDMEKNKTKDLVITNLIMLMTKMNIDKKELSRRSGVSPRMVAYILDKERVPSLDILDSLASVFNMQGWQITLPFLAEDLKNEINTCDLVGLYRKSSDEGKRHIFSVAKREALYSSKPHLHK